MSTVTEEASESTEQKTNKWVYLFDEGPGDDKALLGGKGAGLCEMTQAGLPVPPGLVVTTEACNAFFENDKKFPDGMWDQVKEGLSRIEEKVGKRFGDPKNPLLVSVRSGAAFSMPGMMDTVLNLGLNEETVTGLAEQTGDLRFALDAYRRFASLFGEIVMGVAHAKFERVLDRFKAQTQGGRDTDLKPDQLREVIAAEKQITTIEGLEKDTKLHPLQEAFIEADAMQCGYCTSGMIMAGVALLKKNPKPSRAEIVKHMDRNMCRCGTYLRILKAIEIASGTSREVRK